MDEDLDQRVRQRIKERGPLLAVGLPIMAFVAVKLAGHPESKALLVGAIMLAFVMFTLKVTEWFGVKVAAAMFFGLSAIVWLSIGSD